MPRGGAEKLTRVKATPWKWQDNHWSKKRQGLINNPTPICMSTAPVAPIQSGIHKQLLVGKDWENPDMRTHTHTHTHSL